MCIITCELLCQSLSLELCHGTSTDWPSKGMQEILMNNTTSRVRILHTWLLVNKFWRYHTEQLWLYLYWKTRVTFRCTYGKRPGMQSTIKALLMVPHPTNLPPATIKMEGWPTARVGALRVLWSWLTGFCQRCTKCHKLGPPPGPYNY